ncbi:MAG: hypothetical protein OdinLCB4_001140 [Candidatus Odinarchaeum yellowstonii]|uniref:JAB1/MPN/MOV34 metalloenzyme domain-containing protein n=1 Tax=Odinarchaeota yellowstonii (strain LCB_4) TaxID=1841599 RepID=A0AAF0D2S1_ODILC|nr:MAG: hypothetical protein OdinLCB4_001140 [Candidatus Odinarchaeum yellowstonii]
MKMDVLVNPSVILKIIEATGHMEKEAAGYLTGCIEEGKLIIKDVNIPVQESSRISVKLEPDTLIKTVDELEKYKPSEIICGWFHTHPGMGADFMSQTDVKTQNLYQKLFPEAVALVVDPLEYLEKSDIDKKTLSLYRVQDGKPVEIDFKTTLTGREILTLALKNLREEKPITQSFSRLERIAEFSDILRESREHLLTVILAWNLIIALIIFTVISLILL